MSVGEAIEEIDHLVHEEDDAHAGMGTAWKTHTSGSTHYG